MTRPPRERVRLRIGRAALLAGFCAVFLTACAPAPVVAPSETEAKAPKRTVEGAAHYEVIAGESLVYARVYRGGKLKKLGHNHVVAFRDVRGDIFLAGTPSRSLFDIVIPLAGVEVDPPALRRRQGEAFRTEISDSARSRTRANLLGVEQLDAASHPAVYLGSTEIEEGDEASRVTFDITIRGQTRSKTIRVPVERRGQRLVARGEFDLLQSRFGIEPFSTLGGALKVKDRVELAFTITAMKKPR